LIFVNKLEADKEGFVSQPLTQWTVRIILVMAVIALFGVPIGVSMIPIIGALNKPTSEQKQNQDVHTQSKLEDEARGLELVLQREPENQAALKSLLQIRLQLLTQKKTDIKSVIEPLEKLAKLNPSNTQYTVLLAQAKLAAGDKEGAAAAYRSILQTKPGDIQALQGMVALLLHEKRSQAAIGLLQETLYSTAPKANKIQPGSVDAIAVQVLLGTVYASEQHYTQALTVYDQAIKNDPQDFRPVLAKAMLLKKQGKTNDAQPLFNKAASLAPTQYKDEINKRASEPVTPTSSTSSPR
jgi:tetratricopeptide (TPR) repeat protein